jgi:hypothetical protein
MMLKPCIAIVLCAASLGACDTRDPVQAPTAESTETQTRAVLYDCDELAFVEARPLQGRGFDRSRGGLLAEPRPSYVVFASQAYPNPARRDLFRAFLGAIVAQFDASRGALALAIGTDEGCGVGRTLSIWEDESALFEFATSGAHADAMSRGNEYFESFKTTHWTASADELGSLDWANARQALEAVTPVWYD